MLHASLIIIIIVFVIETNGSTTPTHTMARRYHTVSLMTFPL